MIGLWSTALCTCTRKTSKVSWKMLHYYAITTKWTQCLAFTLLFFLLEIKIQSRKEECLFNRLPFCTKIKRVWYLPLSLLISISYLNCTFYRSCDKSGETKNASGARSVWEVSGSIEQSQLIERTIEREKNNTVWNLICVWLSMDTSRSERVRERERVHGRNAARRPPREWYFRMNRSRKQW